MKRFHVFTVALLFGLAAVVGVLAASRTAGVGTRAQSRSANAIVAARVRALNRFERALHRSLHDRPQALPTVPASGSTSSRTAPRIVYRRPAPIVVLRHTSHHDDGGHETEGGNDD